MKDFVILGASVLRGGRPETCPVSVEGGRVSFSPSGARDGRAVVDASGKVVLPGFTDVHVHLREPGFSYKETIAAGTEAAARSGYTALCAMPNLDPVPDCLPALQRELELIRRDARVRVVPYGSITRGERGEALSDLEAMAPFAAGFSDDGHGVASEPLMREAMRRAKGLGKLVAAHCEDLSAPAGERETREAERNIRLALETGCALHLCHVSKAATVAAVRRGKAAGADLTCETAPHYVLLDEGDVRDDGRFRMNPPIGTAADRRAVLEGLLDGTIDMIATDHAPHSAAEKSRGFAGSLSGITGLECAFPVLYTGLVKTGLMTLARLCALMSAAPARRFGLGAGELSEGGAADLAVFDLEEEYELDPAAFRSLGRSTPFAGRRVCGRCLLTAAGGRIVWNGFEG